MNKLRTFFVMGLVVLFGPMAFGQTVTSTFDEDYNLSRLRTFRFKIEERVVSDPLATDTVMEKKIKNAIEDELQTNGYHSPANEVVPDFLVSFHVKTKDKTDQTGRDKNYVQGSLIVDFYDVETNTLVWRGIAVGVVGLEAVDLKLAEERVKIGAQMLVRRFVQDRFAF